MSCGPVAGSLPEREPGTRYALLLVEEGIGRMQLGDTSCMLIAPAIYCCNEREGLRLLSDVALRGSLIYFHPCVINERFDFDSFRNEELVASITGSQDMWCLAPFYERNENYVGELLLAPEVARHAKAIVEELQHTLHKQPDAHWPCLSRACLLELLFLIRRMYARAQVRRLMDTESVDEMLEPVLRYLHTHYREKLKVDELAQRFATNKTTLNQLVRRYTGHSVMMYINTIRIQMARSMLHNTTLSIEDIMERVGAVDPAHFTRSFRKYTGYPPGEYRKSFAWIQV